MPADAPEAVPARSMSDEQLDDERLHQPLLHAPPPPPPPLRAGRPWQVRSPGAVVLLATTITFATITSGMLLLVPVYRLTEDAICHAFYHDDSPGLIDEAKCKGVHVQSRLAFRLGWLNLSSSVLTLIVALPYGLVADRLGRKPAALLAYTSTALSFVFAPLLLGFKPNAVRANPYLLMLDSLFLLIGGGVPVLLAAFHAMAADVSREEEKATSFLYLTFGMTAGRLLGPILAGILMERYGPWSPIAVVLIVTPTIFLLFLFIPETRITPAGDHRVADVVGSKMTGLKGHLAREARELVKTLSKIKEPDILLVLVTFLFQSARFSAYTATLAQYLSRRFGWKLAEASFLLSPLGFINLLVLAALPKLSQALTSSRWRFTIFGRDLFLTKLSTFLVLLGALIQACSRNIFLFLTGLMIGTLGFADSPLARATVSHYVDAAHTSRLYAVIGMVEVSGSFIGGPALAWLFDVGLRRGSVWIGLPWFYIASVSAIALLALAFVQPPKLGPPGDYDPSRDDNRVGSEEAVNAPCRPPS